jgi:hypothetical protein
MTPALPREGRTFEQSRAGSHPACHRRSNGPGTRDIIKIERLGDTVFQVFQTKLAALPLGGGLQSGFCME